MLDSFKSVAKGTVIYGFANVSIKLLGIILIPIYTNYKYMSRADFGVLNMLDTTNQLLVIVLGLSLYQSFARWYYDPEHKEARKSMYFTVISINALICAIAFTVVFFRAGLFSRLLFHTDRYAHLVWVMFAAASVNIIGSVPLVLLRLKEQAMKYTVISVTKLGTNLLFTVLFVVHYKRGVLGVYQGAFLGELAGLLMLTPDIIRNSQVKFEMARFNQMLGYGLPLLLASVSTVLLNTFDRFSLNYLTDLKTVGTYSLAFRFSNTIKVVVISSIQLSLVPILYKKLNDADHKRFYAKSLNYSTFIVMYLVLFMSVFSLEIIKVFSSNMSYWEAASIIPILSFAMVFVLMKENIMIGLQITKSSAIMGLLIATAAVFNLGMNLLLIPWLGIYGSALSTLSSQILMFALFYFVTQKKYPIPYELRNLFTLILTGVVLYLISMVATPWPLWIRLPFKAAILVAYPFLMVPLKFYEPIELQRAREFLRGWKGRLLKRRNSAAHTTE
jgi:O-antigen/teichoic acid export membrane protein